LRQATAPPLAELVAEPGIGIDAAPWPVWLTASKAFRQMLDNAPIL